MMFQKWASCLHEKVIDMGNVEQDAWILPAQFWAMFYVNDGKYLFGDEASEPECESTECKMNVQFYQRRSSNGPSDFQSHRILSILGLRNIIVGKEL